MRRLLAMGLVVFALSVGATSSVLAASPVGRASAAMPHTAPAVTTLRWAAPFKHLTLSGKATLVVTSTYSSGHVAISATGVKKGDTVHAYLSFRTKAGKHGVLAQGMHVVSGTTGKTSFSFTLTSTERTAIKAHLKAGDTLKIRVTDASAFATGVFKKI